MDRLKTCLRIRTAGNKLLGSPAIRVRRKLTKVSTILIRLCVPLINTKHLVSSEYDASFPSVAQCFWRSGTYFCGSNVRGLSSKGSCDEIISSLDPADCSDNVC